MRWLPGLVALAACDGVFGLTHFDLPRDAAADAPLAAGWRAVTAGGFHTCAIDVSDHLWCWGHNINGETGTGSSLSTTLTPTLVPGSWLEVSTFGLSTCGIKTDHTLWCWGYNGD